MHSGFQNKHYHRTDCAWEWACDRRSTLEVQFPIVSILEDCMWPRMHMLPHDFKCKPITSSCAQANKTTTAKQGVLSWGKNMVVLDPHIVSRVTPVNKGSVWFHWLFLLYTLIQSLTFRSCVSIGLLPYVSIPGVLSFQSSKIVQEYWISLRELPSDSIIPCPPCWTVIFLSVVKEFWVYSVRSPCFMKEDTALGGGGCVCSRT